MAAGVGSLSWALRTRGTLGAADRLRLLAEAVLARASGLVPGRARSAVDVAALRTPDSPLAVAAAAHIASVAPPWLVNHSWRTYLWGRLLNEGRAFDDEALFVAAQLHDLGLTGDPDPGVHCFAVEGALAASRFLESHGAEEAYRARVAEAISLHMNPRVAWSAGAEAHLLHEGAAFDVVGARVSEIAESSRRAVLARHPRLAMKASIAGKMAEQAALRPRSRAAFLCSLGFIGMIRRAAFADGP